jgi:pyridoxine kinase
MGCDVSAIDTVSYSNHSAYRRLRGRKTPMAEVHELFAGMRDSRLDEDVGVLLSGYCPDAAVASAVGDIARELRSRDRPLFWVLDPVMGDHGLVYVDEDVVPVYRRLVREADLVLPNQFEAE